MKKSKGPYVVLVLDADGRVLLNVLTSTVDFVREREIMDLPYQNFEDWLCDPCSLQASVSEKASLVLKPIRTETSNVVTMWQGEVTGE